MRIRKVLKGKMDVLSIIKEEIENLSDGDFDLKFKCIYNSIKNRFDQYDDKNLDDTWVDIRGILRRLDNYKKLGSFQMNQNEFGEFVKNFTNGLDYSNLNTYKKGEHVRNLEQSNKLSHSDMEVYKAVGNKTLFRGVSLEDWKRIENQGYIDTDMRGAISEYEGINLAQIPTTSFTYLPLNNSGVVMAIEPKGLDLYMLRDGYIRVFEPIPLTNVIKISDVMGKNKIGSYLSTNKNMHLDKLKQQALNLGVSINC